MFVFALESRRKIRNKSFNNKNEIQIGYVLYNTTISSSLLRKESCFHLTLAMNGKEEAMGINYISDKKQFLLKTKNFNERL